MHPSNSKNDLASCNYVARSYGIRNGMTYDPLTNYIHINRLIDNLFIGLEWQIAFVLIFR